MYQLRAQGFSSYEIREQLPQHFAPTDELPDPRTIQRWLSAPEATAAVSQDVARIRAIAAVQSAELVPLAYSGLRDALASGDLKSADAGSRVIVNLTRGFIQERIEVAQAGPDAPDELTQLLKRHGVVMSAASSSETPSADDTRSA